MIGRQMWAGVRFILANVDTRNAADGFDRCMRTVRSPTTSTFWMILMNGVYMGAILPTSPKVKTTSSVVTGLPSCHFMPARSVTSMVFSSTHL